MNLRKVMGIGLVVVATFAGLVQGDEGWVKYEAKDYGFSMLIPEGTKLAEKEFGDGWGELWAEHEGVHLYALAKKGAQATPEEIEKVGVKLTGIPDSAWTQIKEGKNESGWIWYRTVTAKKGGKLIIGDYGVGKKASFLLILDTTEADYQENKADYAKWYESITLQ
jgi:hypothetical protein